MDERQVWRRETSDPGDRRPPDPPPPSPRDHALRTSADTAFQWGFKVGESRERERVTRIIRESQPLGYTEGDGEYIQGRVDAYRELLVALGVEDSGGGGGGMNKPYDARDCPLCYTGWASGPPCDYCQKRARRESQNVLWRIWYKLRGGVAV